MKHIAWISLIRRRSDGFPSWPILLTVKDPCLDFDLQWGCYSVPCVVLIFYANSLNTVLQLFIPLSIYSVSERTCCSAVVEVRGQLEQLEGLVLPLYGLQGSDSCHQAGQ